ncbi:MAG: glutamyl-tRNA reductase [Acidimicrobiales bacterium]
MTVLAIGLNHRSAPLDVLERMSFAGDRMAKALAEFSSGRNVNETVLLSTCNRTEIYAHVERFHDAYAELRNSMSLLSGVGLDDFSDHLYVHFHDAAIEHLFSVTAGLDSAVLGEHEILGQVKGAWELARTESTVGPLLNTMFEHAVRTGKRVRTDTAIGRHTASISHAAVHLVTERIGALSGRRVLLVGAGEVGAGVATALARHDDLELVVTNRTPERAEALAAELSAATLPFDQVGPSLGSFDLVISATGAPGTVIDVVDVQRAAEERAAAGCEHELLLLDLAVPRDVDPNVMTLETVGLLVLGDLQAFANRGIEQRQQELGAARRVVGEELDRYRAASSAQQVAPIVGGLHRWADAVRLDEIDRYRNRLGDLDAAQLEAIEALTKAVVKKLLHEPSTALKDAAGTSRGDRLAESVRELFDLG